MIKREIEKTILQHINYFPVLVLTGPRQSGKSTIIKTVLNDYFYVNLENPTTYNKAIEDPVGFIQSCPKNTIIDEAQLAPELFSAIQIRVDKTQINGEFVLTGSHNFLLQKRIKQSLAGRVSMLTLLPLSTHEISNAITNAEMPASGDLKTDSTNMISALVLQGFYPRMYCNDIPPAVFYKNYIDTYITRDVRGYLDVRNADTFTDFVRLLAQDVGGIVNYARYANDLKVDSRTIKNWINILVASYVITLLPSYSTNVRKQIIKSPKMYFCDTGLACYLNDIDNVQELLFHQKYGKIYENFIIAEKLKQYYNIAHDARLYYYRDNMKHEIDLIDVSGKNCAAIEIKSSMTYKPEFKKYLAFAEDYLSLNIKKRQLIYRGLESFATRGIEVVSEKDYLNI